MRFITVRLIPAALVAILSLSPGIAFAQEQDIYCWELYDKYREMDYWAKRVIFVRDYQYSSGDAKFLNLVHDVPDELMDEANKEIVNHFDRTFLDHIRGKIPFHDAEVGRDDRWKNAWKEYGQNEHFYEMFEAEEEARRNALYGSNPGAVYCHIRIERRKFPVLYEMECRVVANAQLVNRGGITKERLGYSTPEHIKSELKNSISEQLKRLGKELEVMRSCS